MFVEDDDTIDVVVHFKKIGKYTYDVLNPEEFNGLEEDAKLEYASLTCKMKITSWGRYNDLQESATIIGDNNERHFAYKVYKENRLKELIVEWDAKDRDEKPVQVNEKSLRKLAPEIAEEILVVYDNDQILTEEKEKN